ncbi:MAG: hypothetical protein JNM93_11295 [Bacteriovoracaceae bacterium]|nr:hypothetical protein [Bacteriovoracaceae bacterium]
MGLLYLFPVSPEEKDHVRIDAQQKLVEVKSFGLPYIFWGYAGAILMVLFFLYLAVRKPLEKLLGLEEAIDQMLGYALIMLFLLTPVFMLAYFFYEKIILKTGNRIKILHRLFFIKVFSQEFELRQNDPYKIEHFLESPNMARAQGGPDSAGFQNKGYFQLFAFDQNEKKRFLDRHSRKSDLEKLVALLKLN